MYNRAGDIIGHKVTSAGLFSQPSSRAYSHIWFICRSEEMKPPRWLSINSSNERLALKSLGGGRKSPNQWSWGLQREALKCLLRKLGWTFFSRALRCQCDAVSMWVGVSQGLAWQKIALCWNVAHWASQAHRGWILIESRCLISLILYKTAVDNKLNSQSRSSGLQYLNQKGFSTPNTRWSVQSTENNNPS